MDPQAEAWDRVYSGPHPVWKGPARDDDLPSGRVLELGCGNGKTLAALVRAESDVTGIDLSFPALLACPSGARLVQGDVRSLPFRDACFDAVIMFHVLEHLDVRGRKKTVEEVRRVLDGSGVVMFRSFSVRDMRYGKGTKIASDTFLRGTGIPYHYFTLDEVRELFSSFNLRSLEEAIVEKRYGNRSTPRAELIGKFSR